MEIIILQNDYKIGGHSIVTEDYYWGLFTATGSVGAYLDYRTSKHNSANAMVGNSPPLEGWREATGWSHENLYGQRLCVESHTFG